MVPALSLYLAAVAVVFVVLLGVFVYYQSDAAPTNARTEHGLTPTRSAGAAVAGVAIAAGFHLLAGDAALAQLSSGRRYVVRVGLWVVVLVAGFEGLAGGYGLLRRARRLRPDAGERSGEIDEDAIAVSGRVTATDAGTAPVTGRDAVCWSWTVEVVDPGLRRPNEHDGYWGTVDGGVGGCRFGVDDGNGRVWVDPADATLDLLAERSLSLDGDDRPPETFGNPAPGVESDYGDRPRIYTESVLEPGDSVAVAGTVSGRADGRPVVDGSDTHVATGSLHTVAARYRRRATLYVAGGSVAVLVGCWGLAWALGFSLL